MKRILPALTIATLFCAASPDPAAKRVPFEVTWSYQDTNHAFRVYVQENNNAWTVTNIPAGTFVCPVAFLPDSTNRVAVTARDEVGLESEPAYADKTLGARPPMVRDLDLRIVAKLVVIVP